MGTGVSAYKTMHREVPIYVYHYDINVTECKQTLDLIPYKYWSGIKAFRFYKDRNKRYEGLYFWYGRIVIDTDGCDLDTIVHELSHHQQEIHGVPWRIVGIHDQGFYEFEEQIWRDIRGN